MPLIDFKQHGTWRDVANAARSTIGMDHKNDGEPSPKWKKQMLLAEHSPIRLLTFSWTWTDLPYWVSVHFVRHKIGIEHFVSTQRTDRTGTDRDELRQDAPVTHHCIANAQAIINISRKRLCHQAAMETRLAWIEVIDELVTHDFDLHSVCVPECMYRGFCPEFKPCGIFKFTTTQMRDSYKHT